MAVVGVVALDAVDLGPVLEREVDQGLGEKIDADGADEDEKCDFHRAYERTDFELLHD